MMKEEEREFLIEIGVMVKRERMKMGLTQKEAAEKLGFSRIAYTHIEYGLHAIGVHKLKAICLFFGLSADKLLGLR